MMMTTCLTEPAGIGYLSQIPCGCAMARPRANPSREDHTRNGEFPGNTVAIDASLKAVLSMNATSGAAWSSDPPQSERRAPWRCRLREMYGMQHLFRDVQSRSTRVNPKS